MSKDIKIKKGLDLKLAGEASKIIIDAPRSANYALIPDDYHGVVPRLSKREGDTVYAGEPIFKAKHDERILFSSPVSGTIKEIIRGQKRKIEQIIIEPSKATVDDSSPVAKVQITDRDSLVEALLNGGCWPFIYQRPYDVMANPKDTPRDIFISAYNSAPIAPDVDVMLEDKKQYLQTAIDALKMLTTGSVHVTVDNKNTESVFSGLNNIVIHKAYGPHPVGNLSTQIGKVNPINKGEKIWTVKPENLGIIGEYLSTGKLKLERIIAVNGSEVSEPKYIRVKIGQKISDILSQFTITNDNVRIVEGNPLRGLKSSADKYLSFYCNQLAILPEGDDYDFFGWNKPQPNKFSLLRANMFSFLTPNKKYALNTNTNGEERAFVLPNIYQEVFPLDIYPVQLIKSMLYRDIDEMEQLGVYEVAPEDFELTEFVCVSKINHQEIVRDGLDMMIREVG